jgi:cell division protein FtsQ
VVEAIDWVDRVRIERRWPNGVRLTIAEQIPGARWGERGLLNARGELFLKDARYLPSELPQLNGPEGTESKVARLYLDSYPRLARVGLRLSRVTLDPRGAWELTVTSTQPTAPNSGGVVVRLGRQDVAERMERFLQAASPLIATRAGEMSYVDMRYSNGFAVGWTDAANLANKSNIKGSVPDA